MRLFNLKVGSTCNTSGLINHVFSTRARSHIANALASKREIQPEAVQTITRIRISMYFHGPGIHVAV